MIRVIEVLMVMMVFAVLVAVLISSMQNYHNRDCREQCIRKGFVYGKQARTQSIWILPSTKLDCCCSVPVPCNKENP